MAHDSAAAAVEFLLQSSLKPVPRTGWVNHHVQNPESVADHSFRMALMGVLAIEHGLDPAKCAIIAIAHDLAESVCGDIVPGTVSAQEKAAREAAGMAKLTSVLIAGGYGKSANLLANAVDEYVNQSSAEARFVKSCDKLDMILQAYEYELKQPQLDLSQFFAGTPVSSFKNRVVASWAEEVFHRRSVLTAQRSARAAFNAATASTTAATSAGVVAHELPASTLSAADATIETQPTQVESSSFDTIKAVEDVSMQTSSISVVPHNKTFELPGAAAGMLLGAALGVTATMLMHRK